MSTRPASNGHAQIDRVDPHTTARRPDWPSAALGKWPGIFGVRGLEFVLPSGARVARGASPVATLRLLTPHAVRTVLTRDQMGMFEAFMDREIDIEPRPRQDAAAAFLAALEALDAQTFDIRLLAAAIHSSRFFWQQTTAARRAKLAAHYSVPEEFWLAFMNGDYPIYSHYLFEENEGWQDWKAACERKLAFAVRVCQLRAGDRLLNIGEGWGGMLAYAGRRDIRHTGLTLNEESYKACLHKLDKEHLGGTAEVVLVDFYNYRPSQTFDAITNMGVTEHLTDYDGMLAQYARLLRPGGYVYSDFVGTVRNVPFRSLIQKYVYPGASAVYLPKLLEAVARNGQFDVVETHDDRLSYDKTCEAWARNVEQSRDFLASTFGERRYRWMWAYLWMCVYGFRHYGIGITGTRVVLRRRPLNAS